MTKATDHRLNGRHPEFARMSLKPGIGADMMDDVASSLMALDLEKTLHDVPSTLRHGSRIMPLGRYLTRRLRTRMGRSVDAPETTIKKANETLQALRPIAFAASQPLKKVLLIHTEGKRINIEGRFKTYTRKKDIL